MSEPSPKPDRSDLLEQGFARRSKSVPSFSELVTPERVLFPQGSAKYEVLEEMIRVLVRTRGVVDEPAFRRAILEREALMTTALGIGIAVPHAHVSSDLPFALALGLHAKGIDYGALDNLPVRVIAMVAQPESAVDPYLEILSQLASFLKNRSNFNAVLGAASPEAVVEIVRRDAPRNR